MASATTAHVTVLLATAASTALHRSAPTTARGAGAVSISGASARRAGRVMIALSERAPMVAPARACVSTASADASGASRGYRAGRHAWARGGSSAQDTAPAGMTCATACPDGRDTTVTGVRACPNAWAAASATTARALCLTHYPRRRRACRLGLARASSLTMKPEQWSKARRDVQRGAWSNGPPYAPTGRTPVLLPR